MSKKREPRKKYRFVDESITYTSFGYRSFHVDPETGEIIGLTDFPSLLDKWLKRGKIQEIVPETEKEKSKDDEDLEEDLFDGRVFDEEDLPLPDSDLE